MVMMIRVFVALLGLVSTLNASEPMPTEFLGSWVLSQATADKLPQSCRNMRLEFAADGNLISFSGELRSVTKVYIRKHNEGFAVYIEKFVEHNGKPNCQGIPAESVRAWSVRASYFECD